MREGEETELSRLNPGVACLGVLLVLPLLPFKLLAPDDALPVDVTVGSCSLSLD